MSKYWHSGVMTAPFKIQDSADEPSAAGSPATDRRSALFSLRFRRTNLRDDSCVFPRRPESPTT